VPAKSSVVGEPVVHLLKWRLMASAVRRAPQSHRRVDRALRCHAMKLVPDLADCCIDVVVEIGIVIALDLLDQNLLQYTGVKRSNASVRLRQRRTSLKPTALRSVL